MTAVLTFFLSLFLAAGFSGHVIASVPFVKQETQYCGPASLASVMSYYGDNINQQEIGKATFNDRIAGSLITDLEDFARRKGYKTKSGQAKMEDIKSFIIGGKPTIALVDDGFWIISRPHYLVIFGYNDKGFIAHNGYEAAQLYPYRKFDGIWEKMGRVYLVIQP